MNDQTPSTPVQGSDDQAGHDDAAVETGARKPYHQPKVRDYGSIAGLTQSGPIFAGADAGIYASV